MIGLYAGSFSVPTMGHMDIIRRAAAVLDGLVVAILVNPEKRYAFGRVEKLLEKSGLPVHMHQRKGKYVVYLKGCQHIADMLTLMGATAATMELENIRIKKEIRNQVNRAMNCDEKNAERQVSAAQKQVEMIKVISIQRGLYTLPPSLQEIARLRLEHPEESLTSLGALLEPPAVLETAITAAPDELRGQVVKATIVLKPGWEAGDALKKELQEHVKRTTAPYKYPRIIEFVSELPKTISGKIRRVELRQKDQR